MKIILKENVERLGRMGELLNVADGYARNYLLPMNLAALATARNVKTLEHEKKVIADRIRKERLSAEGIAKGIGALSLVIPVQVGEEDKLFGSVTSKDIAEAIISQGVEVDKKSILLEKPIKELGIFYVPIKLHHDVSAQIKIEVVKAPS